VVTSYHKRYVVSLAGERWSSEDDDDRRTRPRNFWLCDTEADLPLTTEGQMNGDLAFCLTEGTWWKADGV
jgi:hypothetical protein